MKTRIKLSLPTSKYLASISRDLVRPFSLMVLIILFWFQLGLNKLSQKISAASKLESLLDRVVKILDPVKKKVSISRIDLIVLAVKNMEQKLTRTIITIFGMTIGIAVIVFLISIGYGMQDLVISRVARLEEMRQADISVPPGSNLVITEDTLRDFSRVNNVSSVSPVIALVARASFQNSATDLVAYGVTSDYLEQSAIQPVQGRIFQSNDLTVTRSVSIESESVAAEDAPEKVLVSLTSGTWYRVRDAADPNATILGYTRDTGTEIEGESLEGGEYLVSTDQLANGWVKVDVPVWSEEDGTYTPIEDEDGRQLNRFGYIADSALTITKFDTKEVTKRAGENGITQDKQIELPQEISRDVVVNRSTLRVLGLEESSAVGTSFEISFVATGDLLGQEDTKVESRPEQYTIIAVTPDDRTPVVYVPFKDMRLLGIDRFSQVKIGVTSEVSLPKVRAEIETLGFNTSSVVDTVSGINGIFSTARLMLLVIGMVALVIASLGMFNTLTVSLLERTREVGLMKAMGLKSTEIKELFLAESLIMGFSGGVFGLLVGFVVAKFFEIVLSIYTVLNGVGYISIVSIPWYFTVTILLLSFAVGLLTGLFPARRATKISALNALRYE